jgi:hypothetical protein
MRRTCAQRMTQTQIVSPASAPKEEMFRYDGTVGAERIVMGT